MSHTNATTNYSLPQFITTDKPAWLTDINNAFSAIDAAIHNAKTKADDAYTDAGNAQADATSALTNAAAADAKGSGALASIEVNFDSTSTYTIGSTVIYNSLLYRCIVEITTPGPWTGSTNWERITVDSLIASNTANINTNTADINALKYTDGVSGNFRYRKYNDGTLEVWGVRTRSGLTLNFNSWGSMYYYELATLGDYPVPFTRIDHFSAIANIGEYGNCWCNVCHNLNNNQAPGITLFRATTITGNVDLNEYIYVKGKWN